VTKAVFLFVVNFQLLEEDIDAWAPTSLSPFTEDVITVFSMALEDIDDDIEILKIHRRPHRDGYSNYFSAEHGSRPRTRDHKSGMSDGASD
jgi:hypothetical protein